MSEKIAHKIIFSFDHRSKQLDNEEDDGSMNWDFVCADVFIDLAENGIDTGLWSTVIQDQLDQLIDGATS